MPRVGARVTSLESHQGDQQALKRAGFQDDNVVDSSARRKSVALSRRFPLGGRGILEKIKERVDRTVFGRGPVRRGFEKY